MRHRIAVAVAAAIFLVLAGTGAGNALWSSPASVSSSAAAGTHAVELSGLNGLVHTYRPAATVDTAAVIVRNTGTVSAPFTLSLSSTTSSLATAVSVRTWPNANETCAATTPAGATTSNWTNVPAMTGTLAGGASQHYCVRSTLAAAQQSSLATQSVTVTARLTSQLGTTWTATAGPLTATQTVADTAAPTTPAAPTIAYATDTSIQLTWIEPTDNVDVTSYAVYRDNVQIATTTTPSYTDTNLTRDRAYAYSIVAFDAANNPSGRSAATTTRTLQIASANTYYRVTGLGSSKCVTGQNGSTAANTQLVILDCALATQNWRFAPVGDGYYAVVTQGNQNPVWSVSANSQNDGVRVYVNSWSGATTQQWRITRNAAGYYLFAPRSSAGKCLDVQNNSTPDNTPIQQYTCNGTTAQSWLLTAAN